MNVRLTFTPTSRSQIITVMTIDDNVFEDDERICLRLTNLTEPCPGSVILGNDTEVVIAEDESKFAIYVSILSCIFIFVQFQCLHYYAILIQLVIVLLDGISVYFILPLQVEYLSLSFDVH